MADTVTDNRNLTQPEVGADDGTWGGILNTAMIGYLDNILGATQALSVTSADVNVTIAQWNNAAIKLTGTLTGNRNIVLPLNANSGTVAVGGLFVVDNQTDGAFNVTVKTAATGSTGVIARQGVKTYLYSDTQNVWYADDASLHLIPYSGNPNGFVAGTAASVNAPPSVVWDYTNAILYFCTTTGDSASAVWSQQNASVTRGFDTAVGLQLSVTHTGGNLLNVAVKNSAGVDPTIANPVLCEFQAVSAGKTTGSVVQRTISSALSLDTNALGASLGTATNRPFRIWIALFDNAGTPVLALRNCSTPTAIYPLAEYGVSSTVSIGAGATSAGVWYTPSGVTLSNSAFRLIGYCEYTAGLVTPGTYVTDPTNVVIFGPGIKKPGDVIQTQYVASTTAASTTSASFAQLTSSPAITLNMTSLINLVDVAFAGDTRATSTSSNFLLQLARNSVQIGNLSSNTNGTTGLIMMSCMAFDFPQTAAPVYSLYGSISSGGTGIVGGPSNQIVLKASEIMG